MADVQEIREIIVGFVKRTLPELKYQDIDTSQSMKELGATSIDILEVVSASMRKLNVQVPRDKLGQLKCLDDLINLLASIVDEKVVQ